MWVLDLEQIQLFSTLSSFKFSFIDNGNPTSLSDPTSISLPLSINNRNNCFATQQPSLLGSWAFPVKEVSYHASPTFLPHLINSYSSTSNIFSVNDTFFCVEVLRQQVWKSALARVFFRLKRKLNKMSSDCNLLIFLEGRDQNLKKKKKKKRVLECPHLG